MPDWRHRVTRAEAGVRLDRFLEGRLALETGLGHFTRSHVKRLVDQGLVRVEGRAVKAGHPLRSGEMLEESTLRFIITAHCANALYLPDERIALRYGGGTVDVETRRFSIGGATHYQIVSVGNEGTP